MNKVCLTIDIKFVQKEIIDMDVTKILILLVIVFTGLTINAVAYSWTTISTDEQMTYSGFDIIIGHEYIIQTSGKWGCDPNPPSCGYVEANGNDKYDAGALFPEERISTIVFTVGTNKIGSGTNVIFTSSQTGRLYSVFNDVRGTFDNNVGSVISTIEDITPTQNIPTPIVTINDNVQISPTISPSITTSSTASVNLYGEKTDVQLGDNILLRLSAVNYITKPKMTVQVIIIPPSGMSVISTEFAKTVAGQYTTNYELQPGDGKDIEVKIVPNQIGDFKVKGKIVYYFGDDKEQGEYHDLDLPIKVREKSDSITTPVPKTSGFEIIISIVGILLMMSLKKRI